MIIYCKCMDKSNQHYTSKKNGSSGRKKVLCFEQQNGEMERVYQTYYRAIILPLVERGTASYMFFLYHSVLSYYILLNDVQQFGPY